MLRYIKSTVHSTNGGWIRWVSSLGFQSNSGVSHLNCYSRAGAHGPAGPALAGPLLNMKKDRDTLIEQSS